MTSAASPISNAFPEGSSSSTSIPQTGGASGLGGGGGEPHPSIGSKARSARIEAALISELPRGIEAGDQSGPRPKDWVLVVTHVVEVDAGTEPETPAGGLPFGVDPTEGRPHGAQLLIGGPIEGHVGEGVVASSIEVGTRLRVR